MAKLSNDGKYVTVERGDTLWAIAAKYLGSGSKYKTLAAIPENKISNPDLIYVGQIVYLSSPGTISPTTPTKPEVTAVTIQQFGELSNVTDTLFVTWSWSRTSETQHYEVEWSYDLGNGVWFTDGKSTTEYMNHKYSIPSGARKVRVRVKPISKTKKVDDKETNIYNGSWSSYKTWTDSTPLVTPGVPTIKMEDLKLTASLDNINIADANRIEFQVIKDNATKEFASYKSPITSRHASHVFTVQAGGEYKVRARAWSASNAYSDWSDYSNSEGTIPAGVTSAPTLRATSKTSIVIEWAKADYAKTYDIEYAIKQSYFDGSDQTTIINNVEGTHYEKTGLESGQTYYFRVRAVNEDGHSGWSAISSIVIGSKPTAPTTWSSTTTAVVGEVVNLYWVHNCIDNSDWRYSQLELYLDGVKQVVPDIKNNNVDSEDNENPTIKYSIDTSKFAEGTKIQWRVRTAGITLEYGEWSIERTIDVYAQPTLSLNVTDINENEIDVLTSFPFYIYALAGPKTQNPISYHLEIVSNEIYETTDNVGNIKMVNAGEAVYSKYFDITSSLLVEMSPANINLDNNINYTVICTVSMNSGLTATASKDFTVAWEDALYSPNAEIGVDKDTVTAHIRPYCEEFTLTRYKVTKSGTKYTKTDEVVVDGVYGELIDGVTTTTGEIVYNGTTETGATLYYCEIGTKSLIEGITLSVYRREFDGSFTELATGLGNTDCTYVTDPHPSLDYARYRVVAVDDTTGAVSFYDVPGYPTGVTDIIIQWDEEWSNFDTDNEDELQQPPWSGSLIRLPYDIDVSESSKPDVALVNYIGRSHPVSYYGTQIGQTATWNTNIPYDDKDTIYALRRLQRWMGDVYVREPSGSGYWANITVQFSQKHCNVYVPVTLTITRVEGGI